MRRLGHRPVQRAVPQLPGLGVPGAVALLQQPLDILDLRRRGAGRRQPRDQRLEQQPHLQHLLGAGHGADEIEAGGPLERPRADEGPLADMAPDPALGLEDLQPFAQAAAADAQQPRQLAFRRQAALGGIAPAEQQLRQLLDASVAPAHFDTNMWIGFSMVILVILTMAVWACKPRCIAPAAETKYRIGFEPARIPSRRHQARRNKQSPGRKR